ncbi:hypothetical protein DEU56DRAFT_904790 [Suillus clintonianus]|uniref:uncharacterized protein n=1 Tax=Suillus clintonianus TaxID=1904413 RepID=UPI001B8763E1|nr:uncharacterized protein DEU56DRAFT_904790 [Suillus clintonianus]KAG2120024.1 hypothetical protein DEU56DRAFT_904790 [Suillus clintonianus]
MIFLVPISDWTREGASGFIYYGRQSVATLHLLFLFLPLHPAMATSRLQGRSRTSAREDDDHDDVVVVPKTASVTPLAVSIPSTPPRKSQVLGLLTPLATPDSRPQPNSFEPRFTSPPSTPVQRPNVPKDTKPLPCPGNPSERSNNQSTIIPSLPPAGLLTPDNTPPRLSKPRFVPVRHKEETADKSESTLSLETTSAVVEFSEISGHHTEDIQYARKSKVKIQCNGIITGGARQCYIMVNASERYCKYHVAQGTPSIPPANVKDPQRRQSEDTTAKPTTVKPPAQHCRQHRLQSDNTPAKPTTPANPTTLAKPAPADPTTITTPTDAATITTPAGPTTITTPADPTTTTTTTTTPADPTVRTTVQCSATAKSTGRRCRRRVPITPGSLTKDPSQPIYCGSHIPTSEGIATHVKIVTYADEDGFKVQPVGQEEKSVLFCDHIPKYLQEETQRELRTAITRNLTKTVREPGHVYALNVSDLGIEGKLSLKVGYSCDVKKRHASWQLQCPSVIKDVRGWWPETIIEKKDDDDISIQKLIGNNQQGDKGPMAKQLERLVHIELGDLATHAPYLHPNFPDVQFSDIPRLPKAVPKPCRDCGIKHKEIFSFTRVKEGEFFEREWEDIVKPVIRRWGLFLSDFFAQGASGV